VAQFTWTNLGTRIQSDRLLALIRVAKWRASRGNHISLMCRLFNPLNLAIGDGLVADSGVTLRGGQSSAYLLAIGRDATIRQGSYVSARRGEVRIGDSAYLGHSTWIGGQGRTTIGEWLLCGPQVVIISSNHGITTPLVPYRQQSEIASEVSIGSNVWIGASAVVLPGASIGDSSVVGAGSVVSGSVPAHTVVAGVPARVIREIGVGDAELLSRDSRWIFGDE
jgi:galactoside O-acetyltransferase